MVTLFKMLAAMLAAMLVAMLKHVPKSLFPNFLLKVFLVTISVRFANMAINSHNKMLVAMLARCYIDYRGAKRKRIEG